MRARCLALVAALLLGTAAAQQDDEREVPKAPTAKEQFARARKLEQTLRGLRGPARRRAQLQAAAAYAAVHRHFPEAAGLAARALYRAAELYERARDRATAHACLERLLRLAADPLTQARGRLLLGHLYRRARKLDAALREYRAAAALADKAPTQAARALGWVGRCLARLGRHADARRVWEERLTRFADRPRVVIESYDLIACNLFREGKRAEARATLQRCEAATAKAAARPGRAGQRVRRALARMRIRRLLERREPAPRPRAKS